MALSDVLSRASLGNQTPEITANDVSMSIQLLAACKKMIKQCKKLNTMFKMDGYQKIKWIEMFHHTTRIGMR